MSVEEQERVIGRAKLGGTQLPDDEQPTNSHVTINTTEDANGNELQIMRDSLAFGGTSGEQGTFSVNYVVDLHVTELVLRRMFLRGSEGNYDRILDFSMSLTGCLLFVPPAAFLDSIDQRTKPSVRSKAGPQNLAQLVTGLNAAKDLGFNASSEVSRDQTPGGHSNGTDSTPAPSDGSPGIGNLKDRA